MIWFKHEATTFLKKTKQKKNICVRQYNLCKNVDIDNIIFTKFRHTSSGIDNKTIMTFDLLGKTYRSIFC